MAEQQDPPHLQTVTSTFLLEGLRQPGNDTVWAQFDQRYRPMIVSYARRLGLGEDDAQDAAQQTLIAFNTSYQDGKYEREKGRLRTWLFGIARNQILNARRRRQKREVQVVDASGETQFFNRVEDEGEMAELWEQEWREAVLRQCLEEIRREFDAKTLEAFELFAWKGKSAQEVGEKLDMSANAVFLVKHRVMKRIKALVPKMEEVF